MHSKCNTSNQRGEARKKTKFAICVIRRGFCDGDQSSGRPSLSDPDVSIHGRKNQRPVVAGFHLSVSRDEREAVASRGWPRVRGTPP